jgi:epoxide hydrolase-like predicted phosphatase
MPPVELVIFDYGGVISVRLLNGLEHFEAKMGYPRGSVTRLMFGESDSHLVSALGGESANPGGGDGCDGVAPDDRLHDFHLLEMGRIGLAEYMGRLVERAPGVLGRPLDLGAYREFTASTSVSIHWAVVHRIRRLHDERVALALLTNNVREFGDTWRATFPVELFPVVVDSSEVGMRKPDPRIYELTCELAGVDPAATVFLDDNADNVNAAERLGIETVHVGQDPFDAIARLDAILDRRGLKATSRPAEGHLAEDDGHARGATG